PDPRPPGHATRHLHADRVALRPAPERRRPRARHRAAGADRWPAARGGARGPDELALVRLAPAEAPARNRRRGPGAARARTRLPARAPPPLPEPRAGGARRRVRGGPGRARGYRSEERRVGKAGSGRWSG